MSYLRFNFTTFWYDTILAFSSYAKIELMNEIIMTSILFESGFDEIYITKY